MIEVLKKGTKKQCICENCGAELSYGNNDIKTRDVSAILKYRTVYKAVPKKFIICPQCKKPTAAGN